MHWGAAHKINKAYVEIQIMQSYASRVYKTWS